MNITKYLILKNRLNLSQQAGFTLMELIGVMAVMAILAGALSPNIAASLNQAYSDSEIENMDVIADNLIDYILKQKKIPSANSSSWVTALSSISTFSTEDLEYNTKGYRRRLIFDPRFFTNTDKTFIGFSQNMGLASAPVLPRVLLVSDMSKHVAAVSNKAAIFNAIWNQSNTSVLKESKNLIIKRINLADKFHRVVLSNQNTAKPYYQFENGSLASIPVVNGGTDGIVIRYIIDSTQLNLFTAPYPNGNLEQVSIIRSDLSMRYETNGVNWSWVKP